MRQINVFDLTAGLLAACTFLQVSTLALAATQDGLNAPEHRVPIEHWGCSNCHLPDASNAHLVGQRPGPDLKDIGSRASSQWLRKWIAKPADLRGAPTMPRLFDTSEKDQADLDALVQWLGTLGEPAGGEVATEEGIIASGRELYHQVGCVNCHGALDPPAVVFGDDLLPRETPKPFVFSSFSKLEGKWHPAALSTFLRDPGAVHRDGRMPSLDLSESESDLLAQYLLSKWGPAPKAEANNPKSTTRGREVFAERGCQSCHVVGDQDFPVFAAPALSSLAGKDGSSACLSSGEWNGPRYDFPAPALARMFANGLTAAKHAEVADARLDYLERQTNRLNCRACHEIDGQGGVPQELKVYTTSLDEHADLGDEGRFPPHLNGVGAKLTTQWFEKVLNESGRARPYLATRMPQYGAAVDGFAELFAIKDGVAPHADATWPEATDELVLAGRNLMGMQAGACVSCHSFGDYPAVGTPGPDMTQFAERLRYEWWNEYIADPTAKKPDTRMPSFLNDGKSVWEEPFGGDFQKQTDAMWAYFSLGEFMPTPPGIGKRQSLMLQVEDRPKVFRTFLDSAGSRGIAVGFPLGIHYAFDARNASLVEVWQGDFLDASGSWAGRGGNSRGAPGEILWKSPGGPALVFGPKPQSWPSHETADVSFHGYRLDEAGEPYFQYQIGEVLVVEASAPQRFPRRLFRRFALQDLTPGEEVWLRPGAKVEEALVEGARQHGVVEGSDGESWYRVVPDSTSCVLLLELAL